MLNMLVITEYDALLNGLVIFYLGGLRKELEGFVCLVGVFLNKYLFSGLKDVWS